MKRQRPEASMQIVILYSASLFTIAITGGLWMYTARRDAPHDPNAGEIEQLNDLKVALIVANEKNANCHDARLILTNVSKQIIRIKYDSHPLQYLNLIVCDADRKRVSSGYYGAKFSRWGEERELCLKPCEHYEQTINLFATWNKEARQPGQYFIQAIYEYKDGKYISSIVSIKISKP